MKKDWIPIMIQTGNLKMKFTHLIRYYLLVLILLLLFIFTIFSFFYQYFVGGSFGIKSPLDLIKVTLPIGLITVVYFYILKNKLKFKTIVTNISIEKVKHIIEMTAQQLDWHLERMDEEIIIAKTHSKWTSGSSGEQITIILGNSQIMINSICDPSKITSAISMDSTLRRNKRNTNTLITNLKIARR